MKVKSDSFRWATAADFDALGELMFKAVRLGDSPYTDAQREAWVSAPRTGHDWYERLKQQDIILKEADGKPMGFMSLVPTSGYLDFAYILPEARRQGLFRDLFARLEARACELGLPRIWVHASLMAEPAMAAMGFMKLESETVRIGSETLRRILMEK